MTVSFFHLQRMRVGGEQGQVFEATGADGAKYGTTCPDNAFGYDDGDRWVSDPSYRLALRME
jgi:hypothetical protein